ncbi:MAG: vWA domain-containing protein [Myxococcota bacterium]
MNRTRFVAPLLLAAACSYGPHYSLVAPPPEPLELPEGMNTEQYAHQEDNPFFDAKQAPLSTFSIDVDTASYANVRRFLSSGARPPKDAVRLEELINYFPYAYPAPEGTSPFAVHAETLPCPWEPTHRLVKLGLKAREVEASKRPAANLVFLLDVSGSMAAPNKLPLLKEALSLLVKQLRADDRVAVVVYAGASGLVLPATSGRDKPRILSALEELTAGGSTNGGAGIELAYRVAREQFVPGGINRVILATDGDFNVGVSSQGALVRLIEEKAKSGVFLTVLGLGMGNYPAEGVGMARGSMRAVTHDRSNYKDSTLELLADKGNGHYAYLDTAREAKKVLVEQASGTLLTLAKDVKLQVEFNPARVSAYRLLGYENRVLRAQDFNDDRKDAGELGAGHTVTALYEVVPVGAGDVGVPTVDPLRYQREGALVGSRELLTVKVRHKAPEGEQSQLISFPVVDDGRTLEQASRDARFAAAVAEFGLLLRDSPYKAKASWGGVLALAEPAAGDDEYRREFLGLVKQAQQLAE